MATFDMLYAAIQGDGNLPVMLAMLTILPFSFRTRGRNVLVTSTVPRVFTFIVLKKSCLVHHSDMPKLPIVPALFTIAHKPKKIREERSLRKHGYFLHSWQVTESACRRECKETT